MTSTDPLTERYAALGRISDACLVVLARADADYLEGERSRRDLYAGALVGLNVIAEAIAGARDAGLCDPCEGAMVPRARELPTPLRLMMAELSDMLEGRKSQLMEPGGKTSGAAVRSKREARIKALIIETYSEFRASGWSVAQAQSEIAKALRDAGEKDSTAGKVRNIINQSRKTNNQEPRLVSDARADIRQCYDDLKNQVFKQLETSTSIEASPSPIIGYAHLTISRLGTVKEYDFGDDLRCEVILDRFRDEIRALMIVEQG